MKTKLLPLLCATLLAPATLCAATKTVDMSSSGVRANHKKSVTATVNSIIAKESSRLNCGDTLVLKFNPGVYHFSPDAKYARELYISNHDQTNPKNIGIELNSASKIIIDGNGADFIFNGRMLPFVITSSTDCQLRNLSIDFSNPQIAQVEIVENDTINKTITYRPADYVRYRIDNGKFNNYGDGWQVFPQAGIAFDSKTHHIIYNTSDIGVGTSGVTANADGTLTAPWNNKALGKGDVVAMRSYERPCPAIFVDNCRNITLDNVTVHYAEGMGLLAQNTRDITLHGFKVALRANDTQFFTTQADATHFSGCSGLILSTDGLYEGMMDDAINVHGTYLKVMKRINDTTFEAEYMHNQSYGFRWAEPGDTVSIVASKTMDIAHAPIVVKSIAPVGQPTVAGAKRFVIEFTSPVDDDINPTAERQFGFENLTATPSVVFSRNTVRNNRARGALFSTPRKVLVEENLFDHTSGSAILLCGDCNGWYETGACHDVTIRNNRFVNSLTNLFQFTNAVISIYPEIPRLDLQKGYFHSNIVITDNFFDTFDIPLLYAKSVDHLIFESNRVKHNNDFKPFHWNKSQVWLERVNDAHIQAAE